MNRAQFPIIAFLWSPIVPHDKGRHTVGIPHQESGAAGVSCDSLTTPAKLFHPSGPAYSPIKLYV